jgi:hypothetical protein
MGKRTDPQQQAKPAKARKRLQEDHGLTSQAVRLLRALGLPVKLIIASLSFINSLGMTAEKERMVCAHPNFL